jgi:hypothetical protein
MATNVSNAIQGKTTYVQECGFLTGTVAGDVGGAITAASPASSTSGAMLAAVVPSDGAELVACTFTVTSPGTVTTSGTQQWSISDGTNALATMVATDAETAAGTLITLVLGSATNGKNIATTGGARLVITNTEAGTIGDGLNGIFRLVWAL